MNKDPKFYDETGRLNEYGMACGYIEKYDASCGGFGDDRVTLEQEHGVYHIKGFIGGERYWETADNLLDGRKEYDAAVKKIELLQEPLDLKKIEGLNQTVLYRFKITADRAEVLAHDVSSLLDGQEDDELADILVPVRDFLKKLAGVAG